MRMLVAGILTAATGLSRTQRSPDLRRFGEPGIERYITTNDIGLTVECGSDGVACQLVIERKQPLLHSNRRQQYMPPEVVNAPIDEIVPLDRRGRHINTLLESMGWPEGRVDEYENVWIGRHWDMCVPLKPERESTATVEFKRHVCPVNGYAQLHN